MFIELEPERSATCYASYKHLAALRPGQKKRARERHLSPQLVWQHYRGLLLTAHYSYGSASMISLKRNVPSCTTPKAKFTSTLALLANGVPSVIVPAATVEL